MNTELLAYAAGYIDGDGCIYLGKTIQKPKLITVYEYSIQTVSVKKPVLDHFKSIFGGHIRLKPFKKRHKDAFCWTIKGNIAVQFAQQIFPYLIDKKYQCSLLIEFSQLITRNNFRTVEDSVVNKRNDLIKSIRWERDMEHKITKEDIEALKDKKLTVTPSEIDYPYMAGLIDSEGCFRIKKWKPKNRPNEVYNITVEIGNTRLPVLPWLMERFGGSVVYIPAKANKKASATWTLSAAALYEILPKIRPFLVTKQEICDKLIEFQKTILSNGGDRHSELFRVLFEKRREIRERIIQEIHKLNLKGSH
jgi:hypothetical protein